MERIYDRLGNRLSKRQIIILLIFSLYYPSFASTKYDSIIEKYSTLYSVDKEIIKKIIKVESNFNPKAINKNCFGLMQIQLGTARVMEFKGNPKQLFNPETNIKYGVKYMRYLLAMFYEDKYKALAAYNRGWGNISSNKDWSKDKYVMKVLNE